MGYKYPVNLPFQAEMWRGRAPGSVSSFVPADAVAGVRPPTKRSFDLHGAVLVEATSSRTGTPWETRTTLDASGRPVRVDYADGSYETLAYNADSTVSHRRTRDGVEVDFTYDAANRLTSAVPTLPEGSTSSTRIDAGDHTVYDVLSRPTRVERGGNGQSGYDAELGIAIGGYDLASRPLTETVGTRSPLSWTYDAFDRKTRTTMGTVGTLERSYDTLDRLLTITGPASSGASWSWGGDRLYAMTAHGALGTTTRFGYAGGAGPQLPGGAGSQGDDTTWRLATMTWGSAGTTSSTALPASTWGQFGYGWRGTATSPSDGAKLGRAAMPTAPGALNLTASLGWSWSYDAATRLTGAAAGQGDLTGASPDTATERYGFTYGLGDELERLVRESTGAITAIESGPYGRIASRNGQAFTYDGAGRRLEDDRFVLRWDWRGQLISATVKPTWPDSDGDGQAEVTPYAGHQVRYAYDAAGRLTHRLHLGALPEGSSDESTRPYIDQRKYVWEGPSLLSESSYGLEGTEASLRWRKTYVPGPSGLDDAAQVVVEQGNQSRIYTYLRDELGTVQSIVDETQSTDPLHPSIAGRYFYLPYGEAHVESAPELLRAHIDGDLTSVNGTPQVIADPRLAAPGALLLEWSAALDASTLAAGVALETQVGGTWTALSGADVAIALDDSAMKLTILPTHGWAASTSYRVRLTPSLHDTLGRTLAATETIELRTAAAPATGVMPALHFERKSTRTYESWMAANDTLGNRFPGGQSHLFQGAWTDPVTGLAYHRARWYEARLASWLSEDPAGTVDSTNLYAYVGWGPQRARDPEGLCLGLDNLSCLDWWLAGQEANAKAAAQIASGAAHGAVKAVDFATLGQISSVGVRLGTFLGSGGSLTERAQAANERANGHSADVATLGFASAPDKIQHARELVGGALGTQAQAQGIHTTVEGLTEGNREKVALGGSQWLGGASQTTLALASLGEVGEVLTGTPGTPLFNKAAEVSIPEGVVYCRSDICGNVKPYYGQAMSEERFLARQAEEVRQYRKLGIDVDFEFEIVERATPGTALDLAEEGWIRRGGGPTNKSNPSGALSNKRYEMNDSRYREAGGIVPKPDRR